MRLIFLQNKKELFLENTKIIDLFNKHTNTIWNEMKGEFVLDKKEILLSV